MAAIVISKVERRDGQIIFTFGDTSALMFRTVDEIRDFVARPKEDQVQREALAAILAKQPLLDRASANSIRSPCITTQMIANFVSRHCP